MRKVMILLLSMVLAGLFVPTPSSQALAQDGGIKQVFIELFEIGKDEHRFRPDEIHLTVNEEAKLVFVNTGTEQHEFMSPLFAVLGKIKVEVEQFTEDAVLRDGEGFITGLDESKVQEIGVEVEARSIIEVEVKPGHAVILEYTPEGPFVEAAERDYPLSFFLVCLEEGHLEGGMRGVIVVDPEK